MQGPEGADDEDEDDKYEDPHQPQGHDLANVQGQVLPPNLNDRPIANLQENQVTQITKANCMANLSLLNYLLLATDGDAWTT